MKFTSDAFDVSLDFSIKGPCEMEKIKFIWVTLSQEKNHVPKGKTPKSADYLLSVSAIRFIHRLSQGNDMYQVILAEEQLPNVGFAVESITAKLSPNVISILNEP